MSEETLLTAARRTLRFIRIDESHGGCLSIESLKALETLDKQVTIAAKRAERPMVLDTTVIGAARCTIHGAERVDIEPLEKT